MPTIRTFTPEDYPSFVDIHNSLNIVWPERPRTPEGWEQADRNRNPKCKYQCWVASEDGVAVGWASYGQGMDDYHPQRFYVNVEVRPEYQRRGIGSKLYECVMEVSRLRRTRCSLRPTPTTSFPRLSHSTKHDANQSAEREQGHRWSKGRLTRR